MLNAMRDNDIVPECECVPRCRGVCCAACWLGPARQSSRVGAPLSLRLPSRCFDTGIVRSIRMYEQVGLLADPIHISLVMGVASGMPANPDWLPLLRAEMNPETHWQVIAIGRQDTVWPLLRYVASRSVR